MVRVDGALGRRLDRSLRAGASDAQYLAWAYVGPSSQQRGTTSLTVPSYLAPGTYELRYFVDYGFDLEVTSAPFEVVAP